MWGHLSFGFELVLDSLHFFHGREQGLCSLSNYKFKSGCSSCKKYAMQPASKTMMGQMDSQNNQFNSGAAFSLGSPFSFPMPSASGSVTSLFQFPTPSTSGPVTSPSPAPSKPGVTVDAPATKVEATPANYAKVETEEKKEPKKYAFVDISPKETSQDNPFESFKDVTDTSSSKNAQFVEGVNQNGATAAQQGTGSSGGSQSTTIYLRR